MKKPFVRNRRVRYGVMTTVLTLLIITVTVLANAVLGTLARRYTWYTPMVAEGDYAVTETCYALLADSFSKSEGQVELVFCNLPTEEGTMPDETLDYVYQTALSLAARYEDRIKITCHDIWTNPQSVRSYRETVNPITGEPLTVDIKDTSVIILGVNDFFRVYDLTEFFVFEDNDTSKVWAYDGEKKLAAGMIRALQTNPRVAALTQNHGEAFYDAELLYLLDDAGYMITYLDLHTDPIPADCDLILSYNPKSDMIADSISQKSEIDILEQFLGEGGNTFLVFMDNASPKLPNFESFLAGWGVEFCYYQNTAVDRGGSYRYMVQDSANSLTGDGYTIYSTPVTSGHSGEWNEGLHRPVIFKNATALRAAQGFVNNGDGSFTKGDRTVYSLYQSSKTSGAWANGKAVAGGDQILMTITEQKSAAGSSYVGVVGSVDFCAEDFLQSAVYGNGDAMMRTFTNVGKDMVPEGLTIKPFASTDISIITTAEMLWWTLTLALTPAVCFTLAGVIILVKRRRA